ncbi:MAG TPA: phosphatase PAP2 family protein [Chloroflexota bacterium]|jgi:undecaprenyl-diphosphatase
MSDVLQRSVQMLAYSSSLTRAIAVFCAAILLFILIPAWLLVAFRQRWRITLASVLQTVLLFGLSYVAAKLLSHVIFDQRPYLLQHIQPLIPLAQDNGFPSDHTLLAWALALSLIWLAPAAVWPFVVGAVLVMLGRLGVAAHHTLDVAGSALIVAAVTLTLDHLPLPPSWRQRLFADRR